MDDYCHQPLYRWHRVDIYYIRLGGITGTGNYHRKKSKLPNYYDLSTKDWFISILWCL